MPPQRCSQCHDLGHNIRRCPLNDAHSIFIIRYILVARRIRTQAHPDRYVVVPLPRVYHHAIVYNRQEFGYGRQGITVIPPGTFYWRNRLWKIFDYTKLPPNFQFPIGNADFVGIVQALNAGQFQVGQYCVLHNNCVSFCQAVITAIFAHFNAPMPPHPWPAPIEQYPAHLLNPLVAILNQIAGHFINHNAAHACIFLS